MSWPTHVDYYNAVQSPHLNFSNDDLRNGTVARCEFMPGPLSYSGNFGIVFQIKSGSSTWAVKCFLKEFSDQHERYKAVSDYQQEIGIANSMQFSYLEQGIKVKGSWYPVLKMEWLNGDLLNEYVEKNFSRAQSLQDLAVKFEKMMSQLQAQKVAHGDLQNGNIIVLKNDIRLIDYDCMYVPSLLGRKSYEAGHNNFQHPNRSEQFGPFLDNFSAWVIYTAIYAIAIAPELWKRYGAGIDSLLFQKADFDEPDNSALFADLESHSDDMLRALAAKIKTNLSLPVDGLDYISQSAISQLPIPPRKPRKIEVIQQVTKGHRQTAPMVAGILILMFTGLIMSWNWLNNTAGSPPTPLPPPSTPQLLTGPGEPSAPPPPPLPHPEPSPSPSPDTTALSSLSGAPSPTPSPSPMARPDGGFDSFFAPSPNTGDSGRAAPMPVPSFGSSGQNSQDNHQTDPYVVQTQRHLESLKQDMNELCQYMNQANRYIFNDYIQLGYPSQALGQIDQGHEYYEDNPEIHNQYPMAYERFTQIYNACTNSMKYYNSARARYETDLDEYNRKASITNDRQLDHDCPLRLFLP